MKKKSDKVDSDNTQKSVKTHKNAAIRTLGYIRPYWYLIVFSSIGGVLKLGIPMILPQVLRHFTDDILSADSTLTMSQKLDDIYKWLLILCLIYVFVLIPATFFRQVCSLKVSNKVMFNMRCQLYEHLQKMSAEFHSKNKSGSIVSRISNDVEQVHEFIWNVVTNIWIDAIILVILVVLLCQINVVLTIIAVIALPLSTITTKKIRAVIRKNSRKAQNEMADMSAYVQEKMSGYAVVKLFNNSAAEIRNFNEYAGHIYNFRMKTQKMFSLGEAFIGFFSETITGVIICVSAIFIVKGTMTIGELIIFSTYLGYFTTPLRRFAELNVAYARSIAGIERVYEILDMEPDIIERENAVDFSKDAKIDIEFRDVVFSYDKDSENLNIKNVSFEINEGEKIAFVGSSGCGKTTIVNLLTRFYDVDEGSIMIAGKDLRDYRLDSLYAQIGMVFQDTILFSGTIKENLMYGNPAATQEELDAAARAANAYEFIINTPDSWETMLGEKGIGLSGGQKQRIAIARVFLKNPKLLILDEATSALDSESEGQVQEALDNLMKNRTSIVIAHRLSTIINVDKIIVMDKGEIVEMGKHEELLKMEGRYTELYNRQFKDVLENSSEEH